MLINCDLVVMDKEEGGKRLQLFSFIPVQWVRDREPQRRARFGRMLCTRMVTLHLRGM